MQRSTLKRVIIVVVALLLVLVIGIHVHQRTHFNKNISINNIAVGGLNAQQAYDKVNKTKRQTKVYVNGKQVYEGKSVSSGFTNRDKQNFDRALKHQYTFFPSRKRKNLIVEPTNLNKSELSSMESATDNRIQQLNNNRKASHDAYAVYKNNRVSIVPAVQGSQYSSNNVNKTLNNNYVNGTIRLNLKIQKPLSANSETVQNEKKKLNQLRGRSVDYQVQNKDYQFKTDDIISKATYKNSHYQFNTDNAQDKVHTINDRQSTLGKSYKFKTISGNVINTTNKGTYGWRISSRQARNSLAMAIAHNQKRINAKSDIYGKGYSHFGTGYSTTSNNGIGNTYVAVSLAKQHAWFFKNGKCVLSTNIVSGSNNKGNRTPKGVWYIMYQQSPSVLRGTNDDGSAYASKVQYWSPFTLSGCGFHDASWRTDWSKNAYKATGGGSHGCINMHPSNAGQGFHALSKGEPVIIY